MIRALIVGTNNFLSNVLPNWDLQLAPDGVRTSVVITSHTPNSHKHLLPVAKLCQQVGENTVGTGGYPNRIKTLKRKLKAKDTKPTNKQILSSYKNKPQQLISWTKEIYLDK